MLDQMYNSAIELGLVSEPSDGKQKVLTQEIMVAPLGSSVPDDGFLTYSTVDTFRDILDALNGTVVLFRKDQQDLLAVLCSNASALSIGVQAVFGLPATDYEPWFTDATFGVARISYAPLLSSLREKLEVDTILKGKAERSTHEREVAQRTRKDGSVAYHDEDGIGLADSEHD